MFQMRLLFAIFLFCMLFTTGCAQTDKVEKMEKGTTNHLAKESSPYLLQHARNPVDWYPWGDEALAKATAENKMLIISVGYSACHWCHVMEHESFEDSTVAKIMNENFVCIKVDREERPDVDDVYMSACHLASGRSCGWPLNAFALPNGQPFWAGTYFPKSQWLDVMDHFIQMRKLEPEKIDGYANDLTNKIKTQGNISAFDPTAKRFSQLELEQTIENFLGNIDFQKGGRVGAPKFPMPNNYFFLMRYHFLNNDDRVRDAVKATLDGMANGGIYDHLGGGFARYSTDADWLVPHFEKMMYDNGQLVSLYAQGYQYFKDPLYKEKVEETLEWVAREMTHPDGGFYSSLDADSDGEEGKFYVWQKEEIDAILTDEKTNKVFCDYYEISKHGNWEHGKNILHRKKDVEQLLKKHDLTKDALDELLITSKAALFKERATRIRPGLDDKILTAWNALMLKGYVDAYRAFGTKKYLDAALKNARFLEQNMMQKDFRLNRNFKDKESVINAFLDDYALLAEAFIALYQVTFDEQWLRKSKGLMDYVFEHFYDEQSKMYFYTSKLDPALVARKMVLSDNVIPASNSVTARVLFQLGTYLYDETYIERSKQMLLNMKGQVTLHPQPNFYSNWCMLLSEVVEPPFEVAIIGEDAEQKRKTLQENYLPHALLLGGKSEGSLTLLKDKLQEGKTMIYVCQNKVCKLPVTEVEKALELLK